MSNKKLSKIAFWMKRHDKLMTFIAVILYATLFVLITDYGFQKEIEREDFNVSKMNVGME